MDCREISTPAYQSKETLEELYVNEHMSMKEIAEELSCTPPTVKRWLDRHEIPTRNQAGNGEKPWHSEEHLRELYDEEGLSVHEIAERFGRRDQAIEHWLRKYEIGNREAPPIKQDGHPIRHNWKDGYEVMDAWPDCVRIHRLVAVAEYGIDYVNDWSDYHVHHKNGIKWDN